MMIDVDSFKAYNDTYGHQQGDEALKMVAEKVAHQARRSADLAARFGGEEFAVVLPATDEDAAGCVAEEIRASIAECTLPQSSPLEPAYVTVSIGLTTIAGKAPRTSQGLIGAADDALYKAKHSRKNKAESVTF